MAVMDGPTATLIASALATAVAILGFVGVVYYKLGKLEGKIEGLEGKVEALERRMDALEGKMEALEERLTGKLEALEERLERRMEQGLAANRELILSESRRLSERMDVDYARLSDKMDAQHAETMSAIQRLADLFIGHSHEPDGTVIFRVPPRGGSD